MQLILEIPETTLANLFTTACESGDPVTTASRGGWCSGICAPAAVVTRLHSRDPWYANPVTYQQPDLALTVAELADEATGQVVTHTVTLESIRRGLYVMSQKYLHQFTQILCDDIDAPCADIFLQCVLFGDEKYA